MQSRLHIGLPRVPAALTLLAAGALLAACSTTPSGVSQPTQPPSTGAPTSSTAVVGATSTTSLSGGTSSTTTPSSTGVADPPCAKAALSMSPDRTEGAAGTIYIGFTIADNSARVCSIDGYPAIGLAGPSGAVVPVVSHQGQGTIFGDSPTTVTMTPGGAAGAGFVLSYSDVQQNGQTSCPEVTTIDITMPGQTSPFTVHEQRFYPCGAPNVSVSAIVGVTEYHAQYAH